MLVTKAAKCWEATYGYLVALKNTGGKLNEKYI